MKYFRNIISKGFWQNGFTLIEVMIAAAIGSVILMIIAQSMTQQSQLSKRIVLYADWKNLLQMMRTTYANSDQCTNMFSGIQFGDTTGSSSSATQKFDILGTRAQPQGPFQSVFLNVNQPSQGIQGVDITLIAMPGMKTQNGTFNGNPILMDRAYFNIRAKRVIAGKALPSTSVTDLVSGLNPSDPDTIQLTLYKDPTTKNVVSCSLTGSFDPKKKFSGWTDDTDPDQCVNRRATTKENAALGISCEKGEYAISYNQVSIKGDKNITGDHQCYPFEFQGGWSCYCLGSPNSCCNTALKNCNYSVTNSPPTVMVPELKCCHVRP